MATNSCIHIQIQKKYTIFFKGSTDRFSDFSIYLKVFNMKREYFIF